ncbi:MAG TPA: hypothetical protein VJJ98_01490 [Sedimentisphaerales bacterium]|nr:hypothetical protein [Sedimentisphaerales bacterium]
MPPAEPQQILLDPSASLLLMAEKMKNTWCARVVRTITALLPVSKNRKGRCVGCGACCKLPNRCPFLKYDSGGKSYCTVYPIRPLNCRKYPRTESEFITAETCGFRFERD